MVRCFRHEIGDFSGKIDANASRTSLYSYLQGANPSLLQMFTRRWILCQGN